MLNYTTMQTKELEGNRVRIQDVISDVRNDLGGLSMTLLAISEQPCEIDAKQLATLSELSLLMADALGRAVSALEGEKQPPIQDGGGEPKAEKIPLVKPAIDRDEVRDAEAITGAAPKRRDRDMLERVNELSYTVIRTRDGLRVVIRALEDFAQTDTVNDMGEDDSSLIFGAVNLLEQMADACDRAFNKYA